MTTTISTKLLALAVALSTALLACGEDDEPTEVAHDDVERVVLVDRDTGDDIGDYDDGQWNGELELIADADEQDDTAIGFELYDDTGDEVEVPFGEADYDYDFEIEHVDNVVTDRRDDHLLIRGAAEGETSIFFDFSHQQVLFFDTRAQGLPIVVD